MSRVAKVKNGFAPKVCLRCGLEFEWRKKWLKIGMTLNIAASVVERINEADYLCAI